MSKAPKLTSEQKLDAAITLLQHLLAVELYKSGVTQNVIAKHLHVAKATVVKMGAGVKRDQ